MAKAAARFYRNNPCCGGAPIWISPTDPSLYVYSRPDVPSGFIDNLTPAEQDIADAIGLVGKPPYPNPDVLYGTGPNSPPHAALTKAYQRDLYLRSIVLDDMMNARTGPGTFNMRAVPVGDGTFRVEILLCQSCEPDAMEQFMDDLTGTFGIVEPFLRGVAMVISYVPVLGTAASFIISTALNLADGDSISDSVLTAIGQALPGQPASGMAYEAVRSAIDGDKVDVIAIKALPNPPMTDDIKKVIYITSQIIEAVANGEKITDAALDQLSAQLPKAAQDVMSAARNLANGMPLSDAALAALGRQAGDALENAASIAAAAGSDAINQFVSEAGLQAALDTLPTDIQMGVKAAWTAQTAKNQQEALANGGFTTVESNKGNNDVLAKRGRDIIYNRASVGNSLLSTIRNGKTYTRTLTVTDATTGVPMRRSYVPIPSTLHGNAASILQLDCAREKALLKTVLISNRYVHRSPSYKLRKVLTWGSQSSLAGPLPHASHAYHWAQPCPSRIRLRPNFVTKDSSMNTALGRTTVAPGSAALSQADVEAQLRNIRRARRSHGTSVAYRRCRTFDAVGRWIPMGIRHRVCGRQGKQHRWTWPDARASISRSDVRQFRTERRHRQLGRYHWLLCRAASAIRLHQGWRRRIDCRCRNGRSGHASCGRSHDGRCNRAGDDSREFDGLSRVQQCGCQGWRRAGRRCQTGILREAVGVLRLLTITNPRIG